MGVVEEEARWAPDDASDQSANNDGQLLGSFLWMLNFPKLNNESKSKTKLANERKKYKVPLVPAGATGNRDILD